MAMAARAQFAQNIHLCVGIFLQFAYAHIQWEENEENLFFGCCLFLSSYAFAEEKGLTVFRRIDIGFSSDQKLKQTRKKIEICTTKQHIIQMKTTMFDMNSGIVMTYM